MKKWIKAVELASKYGVDRTHLLRLAKNGTIVGELRKESFENAICEGLRPCWMLDEKSFLKWYENRKQRQMWSEDQDKLLKKSTLEEVAEVTERTVNAVRVRKSKLKAK